MFCVCFGFAFLIRSTEALDYTACNKTLALVWRQCVLSNNFFIANPVYSNVQVSVYVKTRINKRIWGKSLRITELESTTSVQTSQCLNQCATDEDIYKFYNVSFIFENPEGQWRMWATYLHTRAMFNIWHWQR